MSKESYKQAIAEGRRLYREAMEKTANYVLYIVEEFGKPRATVCKEIAGKDWNALDVRTRKLEKIAGQTPDERRRALKAETARIYRSHAKWALQDPETVAHLLRDKPTARAIAKAAAEHQEIVERQERKAQRERTPELMDRAGFNAIAGGLLKIRVKFARLLDDARELRLKKDEKAALREDVESILAIADWFVSFLDSGASDFDSELEKLMEA